MFKISEMLRIQHNIYTYLELSFYSLIIMYTR